MIKELQIPVFDLASSLSSTMDLIDPATANHHKQVAYIAFWIASEVGLSMNIRKEILLAGALHDIGAMSLLERIDLLDFEVVDSGKHCETGYRLLHLFEPFAKIANIVRFHHTYWQDGYGQEQDGHIVPFESHILHIADRIATLLDIKKEIFSQVPSIVSSIESKKGMMFHPELVESFKKLSEKEFFWLDLASNLTSSHLHRLLASDILILNSNEILNLTSLFAKVIDFRSPFTATHSSGVAASAEAISRFLYFSKKELFMMRIAGNLHDLGKVAIPVTILEKEGALTPQEWNIMRRHTYYGYHILQPISDLQVINSWASFHHERIDGGGYPFHLRGDELSLGSRVMAVADVFTAISEDRPYRKGMTDKKIISIMENLVTSGGLDAEIVSVLKENYHEIKTSRIRAEAECLLKYKGLLT
ncbi:HD domain-containing phosphohydrolase [Pelosinus sp. sgz500959]|uniref:HD domain-containing phosphohydrolase n=1 Tax=Pelosinus sp. sgz500959 TaxID=3242472 RepID=UPI003670C665